MDKQILLTPGPTPIPPETLAEEGRPIIHHRTKEFEKVFSEIRENIKYVLGTKREVYLLASSGTGAMECACVNLCSPGDKVIVLAAGAFGERFVKILESYGVQVAAVRSEWGSAVTPEALEQALKENPDAKAVFSTHTDTSTTIASPIQRYGEIVAKTKAVLVVDAISGLGGQELYMDQWHCDAVISASQKGLMAAPGLAFISFSEKAWPLVQTAKCPRFYWDIRIAEKFMQSGQTPFTPAISIIRATNVSLKAIRKKGIEDVYKETRELARHTRELGAKLGLKTFAKDPADVLTGFWVPEGMDSEKIIQRIVDKYNISIAGGQEKLKGRIVRVAHMGYILKKDIEAGMKALAETLEEMRSLTPTLSSK